MSRRKRRSPAKQLTAALWILLILAVPGMLFGGVVAYLSDSAGALTNQFEIEDSVNPVIQETVAGNVKSNVTVDVGDTEYPVYVRAAVVVTWQNSNGDVYWQEPVKGTDYTIMMNETDWFSDGNYWYYKTPVASNGSTENLIVSCSPAKAAPADGYVLNVEILAQPVQAVGTTDNTPEKPAVEDAWGIAVDTDKNLIDPTP